ncbi:Mob4 [Symbiodinium sp. CCMP2592]|nr:Mob4 [Symbiodinium sp. CCMP2592]
MWSWRARPFETYHGPLALAEYIQDLLREDPSDLDRIYELPSPDTDALVWQYEHLRQFVIEFNLLLVALTGTCTPETCPKMTASNDWQYLCAAHRKPQECAAIDYMTHTIDGSTALLTVACPFSSRSQETAMLPVPPFPAALPPAHDSDAPRVPDSGAPSDLVTNLPSDGWISHTGPRGRTSWHHKSLGPAPWGNRPEDYSTPASALSVADTTTLSPPRGPRRDTNPFSDDVRQDPVEMGTQGSQTCEASPDVAHLSPLSFGGVDRRADSSMSLPRDKESIRTLSTEFTPSSTPQVAPTRIPECSDTPSTSSRLLGASPAVGKKMPPDGDRGREFHAESGKATAGTPSTGLRAGCLRAEVHRLTTGVQGWKRHDCRSLLVTGSQLLIYEKGSVDQVKTVVDVGAGEVERCCLVGPGIMSLEVHRKKRRSSSLGRFTSPHRGGGSRSDAREQKLYFFEFDHAAAAQEFCDALASSQFSTEWLFAPRSNGAAQQSTAMEVVNEHDRLYLASHKQCVNASLRDVGFSTVRCNLCNGDIKAGFFVVVMQCKHTFHKECFHNHFSVTDNAQDNPQEPDGIRTGNQVPPFQSDLANPDCPTPEDAVAVVAPACTSLSPSMLRKQPGLRLDKAKVKLDGGGIADFTKTPDGLRILDLAPGKGDECCAQDDIVVVDWSLRRSNGYFVDASFGFDPGRGIDEKFGVGSPELRFSPIGDKGDKVIEGIKKALIGMRVGGTRRVIVPPNLGFVSDDLAPKPNDWGRQRQIDRFKKKDWVIELRLKALRK